ncbi:MAG: TonB-dependent receptor [Pyrinomonadaceae bacterium]|nr:TonB-dependent receptor [Pyrinomonadaceae bacterium]
MKKFIQVMLILISFSVFGFAQSTAGRLIGTVSGPDGLLPGITITATDTKTGAVRTTTSDEKGGYRFDNLSFGSYTVRFSSDGFKSFVANDVRIESNREYSLNATLEIGAISAEVTIQAGVDIVNSTNSELTQTIDGERIIDLPINGRNPINLLNLQAGVNATSNSISGQRASSVAYTRDGVPVADQFIRTGFVEDLPSIDDTAEFTVATQNANASLGGGGSTQVQLTTPRGGEKFSGAGYWNNRNSALGANNFGLNAAGVERSRLNRNQFGGKIGGPLPVPGIGEGTPALFKDKGFFFVNYERDLINQSSAVTNSILLQPYRDGTFSYARADNGAIETVNLLSGAGLNVAANPANFAAVGGAIGVDPTIQARVLGITPSVGNGNNLVTLANGTPVTQEFLLNSRNNTVRDALTMRLDFLISDNHNFYFVHKWRKETIDRPDANVGFGPLPFVNQTATTRSFTINYNAFFGTNWINTLTVGRRDANPFFNESPNFPADFLIGRNTAANTVVSGLTLGLTSPEPSFQNQGRTTRQYTIADNALYTTGNHTLRFGFEINHINIRSFNEFSTTPIWAISDGNAATPSLSSALFPGGIAGSDLTTARNLRWLLGGFVEQGDLQANFVPGLGSVPGAPLVEPFQYEQYGLHFQDQWRIRPDLTLNLGVRWDYFSPIVGDTIYLEPDLRGAADTAAVEAALLNPNGQLVFVGTTAGRPGQFTKRDLDNFAPVLGVAYNPTFDGGFLSGLFDGKTVIRGGFRMSTVDDANVTSQRNAAGANDGLNFLGSASNQNARLSALPAIPFPAFVAPPISFATANANDPNGVPTFFANDPNLQNQQTMEWNFGVQREIGYNTVIEARYVGGYSDELFRGRDLNQIDINAGGFLTGFLQGRQNCRVAVANRGGVMQIGACSAADIAGTAGLPGQAPITTGGNSLTNFNFLGFVRDFYVRGDVGQFAQLFITNRLDDVPFRANPNGGNVDLLDNSGRYSYNAMQLEIRRRFSDGLNFQANYTFQKTLASVATDGQARFNTLLDNANPELEYARPNYDRTHTININSQYELPFGRGRRFLDQGGILNALFGGWALNNIMNIGSGAPISIRFTDGTLNRAGRSLDGTAMTGLTHEQVRDLIGLRVVNGIRYYIDPSVIAPDGTATGGNFEPVANANFPGQVFFASQPGQTGNLPRNFINGPWYWFWNAGLRKNFGVGEKINVQLRADAFNVLNTTYFNVVENSGIFNIESSTFGQIPDSAARAPRIFQLGLRIEF